MTTQAVNPAAVLWPAFIKYQGDSGLLYISSQQEWDSDPELNSAAYETRDRLIDSTGAMFSLSKNSEGNNILENVNLRCDLKDAIGYVQEFAVAENYCCSSKIHANNFTEILAMIRSLDEEG